MKSHADDLLAIPRPASPSVAKPSIRSTAGDAAGLPAGYVDHDLGG
jgi:hypothetical protein